MKTLLLVSRLFLFLAMLSLPAVGQDISTWKGGNGSWDDTAKWTGGVPNSAAAVARVDNANAMNSDVTLGSDVTVGQLLMTSSDGVRVPSGRRLTIDGHAAFAGQGTISGGSLRLDSAGGSSTLFVAGEATISSTLIGASGGENILTGSSGSKLTIDTIFCTGITQLGGGAIGIVVNGSLSASSAGMTATPTSFVLNENASFTIPKTATLGGAGTYTLNGTVALTNGSAGAGSLTKAPTATLSNFDTGTKALSGGRYLLLNTDGAAVDLNLGPILINNAEIEMVRATSSFAGLDQLQSNLGKLTFNARNFTLTGAVTNSGEISVSSALFSAPGMTNSGTVRLLTFSSGATGTITLGAGGYTQSAGAFRLNGTTVVTPIVNSTGPFAVNGGRLEGGGQINAAVQCNGTLAPFTANNQFTRLDINGALTLGGTLEIRVGTPNTFSQRQDSVVGFSTVALGGELKVFIGSVADPDPAVSFTVLSGTSFSGQFTNVTIGARLKTFDGRGSFLVQISANSLTLSAFEPTPARGIGLFVPGEAIGTTYAKFGPPAQGPFGGSLKAGKTTAVAIFAGDGRVRARVGGDTPLSPIETVYTKLGEPSGDAALATVRPNPDQITTKNDQLLLGGLIDGPVRIAVREGVTEVFGLPGVTVKSFSVIEGSPTAGAPIFFSALLQGTTVTGKDDLALCAALPDGKLQLLVREGQMVGAKKIKVIGTLVAAKGSLAEGRWRAGDDALGVRLTFVDKSSAIYSIPITATDPTQWTLALDTETPLGAPLAGVEVASLGLPGFGASSVAFLGKLKTAPGLVKAADDQAIFVSDAGGLALLAREGGDAAEVAGAKYKTFSDPVSGDAGATAFMATLSGVPGAGAAGIWSAPPTAALKLVARASEPAPGGGSFATFSSLALPDGTTRGPIFTAKLAASKTPLITAKNNFGLWAVNSTGTLIKLLRTGDSVMFNGASRTVKSFTALVAAPGSTGATRGYDGTGAVTVLATFDDLKVDNILQTKSGLVHLAIP